MFKFINLFEVHIMVMWHISFLKYKSGFNLCLNQLLNNSWNKNTDLPRDS